MPTLGWGGEELGVGVWRGQRGVLTSFPGATADWLSGKGGGNLGFHSVEEAFLPDASSGASGLNVTPMVTRHSGLLFKSENSDVKLLKSSLLCTFLKLGHCFFFCSHEPS